MSQNRSTAVMQRRVEAPDSLDYFPTPPWATRALMEWVKKTPATGLLYWPEMTCWEPACGEGYMSRPLAEYFAAVRSSDCHDYGFGDVDDFVFPRFDDARADWIISNPPFRLAAQFIEVALDRARFGVAMLVRSAFLEGIERHRTLFLQTPPAWVLQFCERVSMVKGRVDENIASATAYCWLIWAPKDLVCHPRFGWIAPCRKRLERPRDYEPFVRAA